MKSNLINSIIRYTFVVVFCFLISEIKGEIIKTDNVILKKDLIFTKYVPKDSTKYNNKIRVFQWSKIAEYLIFIDSVRDEDHMWGVISNYKNRYGEAPVVKNYVRNEYNRVSDTLGTERYQSVPFYSITDTITPVIYGKDGWPVVIIDTVGSFVFAHSINDGHDWYIPKKYIPKTTRMSMEKVIFVDRKNQNICTIEKDSVEWKVRSMNPATTGLKKPPYMSPTPLGIFVIQEKKAKMIYLKDGSTEVAGFSPYASRFSKGGYIHGIPVNLPSTEMKEYSPSLGTTPRSHMCVRNATSHAKYVYQWAKTYDTLVIVIE